MEIEDDWDYRARYSPADRRAMVAILGLVDSAGETWITNAELGALLGVTKDAVRIRLRRLERLGYVVITWRPNRRGLTLTDAARAEFLQPRSSRAVEFPDAMAL